MKTQPRAWVFGEILFDVYPGYKRLGGAPFNFAYHLHQFGVEATLISRIGQDAAGQEILDRLAQFAFPAHAVQRDSAHATGTVVVSLQAGGIPNFQIVEEVAYDFITAEDAALRRVLPLPDLLYFGTLAQRHAVSRQALHAIMRRSGPPPLVFCDLNLRQTFYTAEILRSSMRAGNVLKLNSEEFGVIQKLLQLPAEAQAAARQLMQQFDIRCLCITQGDRGSVLCSTSERIEWGPEHQAVHEVVDTVGAGDAYAAVLAFGLLEHWPLATSAARASQFAAAICTISGAIPEQQHFYAQHAPWLRASA